MKIECRDDKKFKQYKELNWLVPNRSAIEQLLLNFHNLLSVLDKDDKKRFLPVSGHLVGAGFSLWRAVFHANKTRSRTAEEVDKILETIIETNAVTFGDQKKTEDFTAGYYINNAIYRMQKVFEFPKMWDLMKDYIADDEKRVRKEILDYAVKEMDDQKPQTLWETAFGGLRLAMELLNRAAKRS